MYALARRGHGNRIVVPCCPYCKQAHYHGHDGSGEVRGSRVADCGGGQYELTDSHENGQWTDEEWKQFEAKLEATESHTLEMDELIKKTSDQTEHPEWYESPCDCQLCRSYGD